MSAGTTLIAAIVGGVVIYVAWDFHKKYGTLWPFSSKVENLPRSKITGRHQIEGQSYYVG